MNTWLLTNIPSPYQVELLRAVSCSGAGKLAIRFMRRTRGESPSTIGCAEVRYLKPTGFSRTRDELVVHPQAVRECWRGKWDAFVLSGTIASPTLLLCCVILHFRRKPWLLWLERPHPASDKAPWGPKLIYRGPVRWVRNQVMNWLLRNCTGLIAIGSKAKQEYIDSGVNSAKVSSLSYCCDTSRFKLDFDVERIKEKRRSLELEGRTVLLFSGQLIERKGIQQLLAIFERAAKEKPNLALLILGDGPLLPVLQSFRSRTQLHVVAPGHLPQTELPDWFRLGDIFLFPSRHDGWGVVVNEACAAGLPCIVSAQTGAALDLVQPGKNGYILDWWEEQKWVETIVTLVDDGNLRKSMGLASRRIAEATSAEARAINFWQSIEAVNASHP